MRVLVCGGRDYQNTAMVEWALDTLNQLYAITDVIHGDARGADTLAGLWAYGLGISVHRYPANWNLHGKAAGGLRNQQMIDEAFPDYVVAFPGGRGTADMVRRAKAAGLTVWEIKP